MTTTGAADARTLYAVTICYCAAATAANSNSSASLVTDHLLASHALIEVYDDHRQSSRRWLLVESEHPPLDCVASVLRAHYYVKDNTQLNAGTER